MSAQARRFGKVSIRPIMDLHIPCLGNLADRSEDNGTDRIPVVIVDALHVAQVIACMFACLLGWLMDDMVMRGDGSRCKSRGKRT
jgi:hypothetical protein